MFDDLTWDAMLQAWPWFGAAAVVFIVAVGSFIALKPKPKRQPETPADKMGWTLTGRIDLADPQSVGVLVLEVEETRISVSPSGVEHREICWRRATLSEAKMVLESYHAQQNLPMSATFMATAPAGTKRKANGQAESIASGNGLCCSFADGFRVDDVDWDTQDDHYRVHLQGEWIVVPDNAVVTEPNKFGPAVVWPYMGTDGQTQIRCFLPGAGA